jgi:hypothetical protein
MCVNSDFNEYLKRDFVRLYYQVAPATLHASEWILRFHSEAAMQLQSIQTQ